MNCVEARELLSHYYDSELPPDERARVATHVDGCVQCSAELARFGKLSAMVHGTPAPLPDAQGSWKQLQEHLGEAATVGTVVQSKGHNGRRRHNWWSYPVLRPAIAVAALLLVAVGWFAFTGWVGDESDNLLAADFQQYAEQFQRDPNAAQQVLMTRYAGQKIRLEDAVRRVSYQPVAAGGLPDAYTVNSMYLLKTPCCDCLQTVCQRDDGSQFVIFEYGEEHPASVSDRSSGMAPCCGENCCLAEISDQFAISWQSGERHISVVGVRDQAEIQDLAASLR